eukprot:15483030-Alexandrium_andersonii.AAC.1
MYPHFALHQLSPAQVHAGCYAVLKWRNGQATTNTQGGCNHKRQPQRSCSNERRTRNSTQQHPK